MIFKITYLFENPIWLYLNIIIIVYNGQVNHYILITFIAHNIHSFKYGVFSFGLVIRDFFWFL